MKEEGACMAVGTGISRRDFFELVPYSTAAILISSAVVQPTDPPTLLDVLDESSLVKAIDGLTTGEPQQCVKWAEAFSVPSINVTVCVIPQTYAYRMVIPSKQWTGSVSENTRMALCRMIYVQFEHDLFRCPRRQDKAVQALGSILWRMTPEVDFAQDFDTGRWDVRIYTRIGFIPFTMEV